MDRISNVGLMRAIDEEKRTARFLSQSTAIVPQDGLLILANAGKKRIKEYMNNPVVLASHNRASLNGEPTVIGKVINNEFTPEGLFQTIEFAETPLAENYWSLVKGGFMRAVSISSNDFNVETDSKKIESILKRENITISDKEQEYLRGVITEYLLNEVSLVALPADRKALAREADNGNTVALNIITEMDRAKKESAEDTTEDTTETTEDSTPVEEPTDKPEEDTKEEEDKLDALYDKINNVESMLTKVLDILESANENTEEIEEKADTSDKTPKDVVQAQSKAIYKDVLNMDRKKGSEKDKADDEVKALYTQILKNFGG